MDMREPSLIVASRSTRSYHPAVPTYEYRCTRCGAEWELQQRMSDPASKRCPRCEDDTAQRLISSTSFALKGGGWAAERYGSTKP
jgi:putative FmdB family regulatory protein